MIGTLEYKGYRGTAAYSEDDRVYRGEILGIAPHVMTFEAASADELEPAFRDAVDEYVAFLEWLGES